MYTSGIHLAPWHPGTPSAAVANTPTRNSVTLYSAQRTDTQRAEQSSNQPLHNQNRTIKCTQVENTWHPSHIRSQKLQPQHVDLGSPSYKAHPTRRGSPKLLDTAPDRTPLLGSVATAAHIQQTPATRSHHSTAALSQTTTQTGKKGSSTTHSTPTREP